MYYNDFLVITHNPAVLLWIFQQTASAADSIHSSLLINPLFKKLQFRKQQNDVAFQPFPLSISVNGPLQPKPKSKPPILKPSLV